MSSKKILYPICIFATAFLLSCAGQIAPSGGPVDSVPPTIIRSEPDTNSVRVDPKSIVIEFSEYVDRRSVEESIFISPYVGELEFDWSGREVEVSFNEQLRTRTTYVVSVGTDVVDVRARNRMANSFTLAFSTGDSIDRGMIKGRVFDDKPEGVMMFAYALDTIHPDTLDPSKSKPDYIVQTGKDGLFTLSNLGWGTYRLFAIRDEYKNLIYDKQVDQFGVTTRDIAINEKKPMAEDVWFRLAKEDTTKPFLTKVQPLNAVVLRLRFSEQVDSSSFERAAISINDTVTRQSIGIVSHSMERADSTFATVVVSTSLDSGKGFRLAIEGVRDLAGNLIDSANASYSFGGFSGRDTLKPTFSVVGLQDSIRDIPLDSNIEIRFSEPVQRSPLNNSISLLDSTKRRLPASLQWWTLMSALLKPEQRLTSKQWYTFQIVMDSLKDLLGNAYKDSVNRIRFQSLDLKTTGTVEGFVVDADSSSNRGTVVLAITQVLAAAPFQRTVVLQEAGKFKFEEIPEGRYAISAFRDRDLSLTYSYGKPFPFQFAERFAVYSDTIKVRARWGVEGVNVSFKKDRR